MANPNDVIDKRNEVMLKLLEKIGGQVGDAHDVHALDRLKTLATVYAIVASETPQNTTIVRK